MINRVYINEIFKGQFCDPHSKFPKNKTEVMVEIIKNDVLQKIEHKKYCEYTADVADSRLIRMKPLEAGGAFGDPSG